MELIDHSAVHINELTLTYPGEKRSSLSNIQLDIRSGSRFGIFGPNGAGKTSLLSCITGLLHYSHGEVFIFGEKITESSRSFKKNIGLVPQDFAFYQELSVRENLEFFGALYGLTKKEIKARIGELLEKLQLTDVRDKPLQHLSGGMKRRVNLAIGVIHQPLLLILDEPTVGVDVQTRTGIMSFLKDMNASGTTIVYTSHQLAEAEELCNDVAFISEGIILLHDSLDHLRSLHQGRNLEELFLQLTEKQATP